MSIYVQYFVITDNANILQSITCVVHTECRGMDTSEVIYSSIMVHYVRENEFRWEGKLKQILLLLLYN